MKPLRTLIESQQSSYLEQEQAIFLTKTCFEKELATRLPLVKVQAPAVVFSGTGINDDLNGVERPVSFPVKDMAEQKAEVVQSLAKWKRMRLAQYAVPPGQGIFTDMRALRPDEALGPIHSVYVDQWDWEMVMDRDQRKLSFLKEQVQKIYQAIRATAQSLEDQLDLSTPPLPDEITFLHSEDLLARYPEKSPKEREHLAAKEFGAIFLIGVGAALANAEPHDKRAPDYDDWTTKTGPLTSGLNGDIILWNPVLGEALEISSMGIRVDAASLHHQLELTGTGERASLSYHRELLQDRLPQTIGGGIGQSRLCMFLLQKKHIAEVQVGLWPEELRKQYLEKGINFL